MTKQTLRWLSLGALVACLVAGHVETASKTLLFGVSTSLSGAGGW